jgi:hypothetical protein
VQIIHPCWSGSVPVLVENAAEPVPSPDIEVRDLPGQPRDWTTGMPG